MSGRRMDRMDWIHQSNARANHRGERIKDVDGRVQPFCQFIIAGRRLFELLDLTAKDSENVSGRVAGLHLGHQRMSEKVFLCLLLVLFHRRIKYGM
jgi:hypothetical protein